MTPPVAAAPRLPARWLYAAKPASWPKLLMPCALGQAMGRAASGAFSLAGVAVGLSFTLFGMLFIVLLNDWGDQEVDAIKRRMFPDGCSPKTIPDRILGPRTVLLAGSVLGALALASAFIGAHVLGQSALVPLGLFGMLIFVAYTLPPLRLNYRGGGELLEMLGAGAVLPLFNSLCQAPVPTSSSLWPIPGFLALSLASAVASGLSDEQSDRAGGKTTVVTRHGNPAARRAVQALVLLGGAGWLLGALFWGRGPLWPASGLLAVLGVHGVRLWRASAAATTNAFAAQARYKTHLHRAIWQGALVVCGWLWLAGGRA